MVPYSHKYLQKKWDDGTFMEDFPDIFAEIKDWAVQGEKARKEDNIAFTELNFGDALIFNKCTLHSASGISKLKGMRRAL